MFKKIVQLIFLVFILFIVQNTYAQSMAFPGAEGCGKYTTGGRGGEVVYVTNLNDEGPGSLRHALRMNVPRIIVFSVSGTLFIKSKLDVSHGNFTMAGQSAPGDGICIAGDGVDIEADNIIIRYVRFRPGDISGEETDALTIKRSDNVIVDHCSMSWSTDETCSCYDNTNFTLQWCMVSESLDNSVHKKGEHGYGGIWGGKQATFHHNLLSNHISRNPRLHGARYHKQPQLEKAEIVNNVIYNWRSKCMYAGEQGYYTIAENYFKTGPATSKSASKELLEPYSPYASYYFKQNILEGNKEISGNNLSAVEMDEMVDSIFISSRKPVGDYELQNAEDAYNDVVKQVGASLSRDIVDQRLINELVNGTSTFGTNGIINSQKAVGGWPELKTAPAPVDTDQDGMPDQWEIANNLNPNSDFDGAQYDLSLYYTNIEVYLNSLTEK